MLNVQFTNPDDGRSSWIKFPAVYSRIREGFVAIGDGDHPVSMITAVESSIDCLHEHLAGKYVAQMRDVDELGYLSQRIEGFTKQEKEIFSAMLEIEKPYTLMEIVNLSCNMDKFAIFPGIVNEADLGECLLKRGDQEGADQADIEPEDIGKSHVKSHAGVFCGAGYVYRSGETLKPIYDGRHLPDPGYDPDGLFLLHLYPPAYAPFRPWTYSLSLPAQEEKLALAKESLGARDLEDCSVAYVTCPVGHLKAYLPCSYTIRGLNHFADLLKSKVLDGTKETLNRLCAVLTAEMPADIHEATVVAANLKWYDVMPEKVRTPADYAHYVLEEAGISIDDEIHDFLDFEGYGRYRMLRDGIVQTEVGMVFREDAPIRQLTEHLSSLKLFSPLYSRLYEQNEWDDLEDDPVRLGTDELCDYQDKILAAIEQEKLFEEGERGLAVYLDNELLKRKVFSMIPTVEEWNGRLWGVLKVESYGSLSDAELKAVMNNWRGQASDGWGESFEQRGLKIEAGELYISFWGSDNDFFIKTERELKDGQEQRAGLTMGGM